MTKDNLIDLIDQIEKDGFNYVVGILKPITGNSEQEEIEIYSNYGEDGLSKLLKVLKEHQKSSKVKEKSLQKPESKVG